jgi:beta-phosphoglucomutase-like phosphatase (HAD superfamily)
VWRAPAGFAHTETRADMQSKGPAILWDMDGTLVDSEPLHEAALVKALDAVGIAPPQDFHQHIIGRDAKEVHGWCREHLGLDLPLRDWLRLKYRTYLASVIREKRQT